MSREADDILEADRFAGALHPREQLAFFGHAAGLEAFASSIRDKRIPHAWLIGGPEGIGKATLAYRVTRHLLHCGEEKGDLAVPPEALATRQIAVLSHPNLTVLRRGLNTTGKGLALSISVDSVRRMLGMFNATAANGGYRICIVDSAEDLTIASANALLKVIEEPPPDSLFLIVSHQPQKVLPTIRSRCRKLSLRSLSLEDVKAAVLSLGPPWSEMPRTVLDQALVLGEGSVRRTLDMLDENKLSLVAKVSAMLDTLPKTDPKAILALAQSLSNRGAEEDYELVLDTVKRWVSERLHQEALGGTSRLAPLVEVCENITRSAREVEIYNLDRRPLILTLLDDLADAVRRAA